MSWNSYVEGILTSGKISDAAILGQKGGVWASSKGLNLSTEEEQEILSFYGLGGAVAPAAKEIKHESSSGAPAAKEIRSERSIAAASGGRPGTKETEPGTEEIKPGRTESTGAKDQEPEVKTGVRLSNEKYFTLTRIEDTITFRKGSDGALFAKTNQAILVAIYRQPIQAQEALVVVEHYAGYLKANGI